MKLIAKASQSLSPLAAYLHNPHSQGVQYAKLSVDQEAVEAFRTNLGLNRRYQDTLRFRVTRSARPAVVRPYLGRIILQVRDELLENEKSNTLGLTVLKPLLEWSEFVRQRGATQDSAHSASPQSVFFRRALRLLPANVFGPNIPLDKMGDALHISELPHENGLILEACSINPPALDTFISCFRKIPDIGTLCRLVTKGTEFASRVVYDLVPAAASSWTRETATIERVPPFILSYMEAAYNYIELREWRTSIVLSAIALESLLAEMYENEFREPAPEDPLGSLRYEIEQRFKKAKRGDPFPKDVSNSIKVCNDARISAVHRGGHQPSAKEAHEALSSAVRFSIWSLFTPKRGRTPIAIA